MERPRPLVIQNSVLVLLTILNFMSQKYESEMTHSERSRSRTSESSGNKKSKAKTLKEKLKSEKDRNQQLESNIKSLNNDLDALKDAYVATLGQLQALTQSSNQKSQDHLIVIEDAEGFSTIENKKRKIATGSTPDLQKPNTNAQTMQQVSSPRKLAMPSTGKNITPKSTTHSTSATNKSTIGNPSSSSAPKPAVKIPTPSKPPLIFTSNIDVKAMSTAMENELGHKRFQFRPAAKGDTAIITQNDSDYKATMAILKSSDVVGHSYTLKNEKKFNVILRNLHASYEAQDIAEAIGDQEIDVQICKIERYVTPNSSRQNVNLNLWHIQLEPGSDVNSLLSITSLLNQTGIRFERMHGHGIAQCRNCQQYGHSAINCFRKYRCVKCTGDHSHGECTKTTDDEAACINCNGKHPANYRGCQIHKDLVKRMNDKKISDRKAQAERQAAYQNYRRNGVSYANATGTRSTSKNRSTSRNRSSSTQRTTFSTTRNNGTFDSGIGIDIQAECRAQFGMDFKSIRQRLTDFAPYYNEAEDKSIALLQFIASIHPDYQQ